MFKIGILTDNIKKDIHSAQLFEEASKRAQAYYIQPKDLQLKIIRNTPLIKAGEINLYEMDALFIRQLNQSLDTDLQFDLLSRLQQAGVLLVNSCQSLAIAESKVLTNHLLALYGLPVIESLATQQAEEALNFVSLFEDAVIKPLYGNLGEDVFRISEIKNPKEEILRLIEKCGSIFVQRFVASKGKDFRIFVINDHVCAAIERKAKNCGWLTNIYQGGKAKKVSLNQCLRNLAVKSVQIIGLDYCGLDLILENGKPYILELNGSSSWQGIKEATQKNIPAELVSAVIRKLENFRRTGRYLVG